MFLSPKIRTKNEGGAIFSFLVPYISGPNIISKVLPKYDDSLSAIFPDLVDCCSQKNRET